MARMPGADWQGEHGSRSMSRYDIVCVHTIVGYAPAHAAHFSVKADGTIIQSRDTRYRSAANLNGNHRVIAIENEDHGSAFGKWPSSDNAPPLTAAQVEANAQILAWAHRTHGVPLQLCPNSRSTSRGLAYHRQGIDGNFGGYKYPGRVSGGEVWTTSYGKVCPTDNRIAQRPEILARAKQIVAGGGAEPKPPEDEMTPDDRKWLTGWMKKHLDNDIKPWLKQLVQADVRSQVNEAIDERLEKALKDMPRAVNAFQASNDDISVYTRVKRIEADTAVVKAKLGVTTKADVAEASELASKSVAYPAKAESKTVPVKSDADTKAKGD